MLELHAELRDAHQDYSRALAFRRASCVFRSLPFALKYSGQLAGLKDVGEHVKRVVTVHSDTCVHENVLSANFSAVQYI